MSVVLRFHEHPFVRSLALHLGLLLLFIGILKSYPLKQGLELPIEITLAPKALTPPERSKSIVRSEAAPTREAAPDSYLSDRNRKTNQETVAKQEGSGGSPRGGVQVVPKPKSQPKLSDLGMKMSPTAPREYSDERRWADPRFGESLSGGQYIQGVKEGEVTALNTKEFVFYSYFERVRRQLDQAWQPLVRQNIQRILKSGRKLASNSDHVTRALVTMDSEGRIQRIQVLEESGSQDLDQAAVDALNRAGPYPNPPKGLRDEKGQVQIRWDFILKT
jgi:TonB family protein